MWCGLVIVSTAPDWSRFYTALMSGELLPAAQLTQMRTTVPMQPVNPVSGPGYGLGIVTLPTSCGTVWAHDGALPGYFSINFTDSTGRRTATVLVSTELFAEFEFAPKLAAALQKLQDAVVCSMVGPAIPSGPAAAQAH